MASPAFIKCVYHIFIRLRGPFITRIKKIWQFWPCRHIWIFFLKISFLFITKLGLVLSLGISYHELL